MKGIRTDRRALLTGVALVFAAANGEAFGADAATAADASNSARSSADTPAQAGLASNEIIVTAQHRNERLRDVPITITSKTADQLDQARVTNITDLTRVVPGLVMNTNGGFIQPSLRGVASLLSGTGFASPVAIYLDGVYQPNPETSHFDFADLARVEVDKGPQGTLYGFNATGGAVAVFTKAPSFTPSGDFEIGYGNYNDFVAKGFVTGPLVSDTLAASISGLYETHDDYAYDIARHQRPAGFSSKQVRAKLLFTPASNAKFTLTGAYEDRFDSGAGDLIPLHGNTIAAADPNAIIATRPHQIALNNPSYLHVKAVAVTLNSEIDFEVGTLTSITGFQHSNSLDSDDDDRAYNPGATDPNPFPYKTDLYYLPRNHDTTWSEDLNFSSRHFGPFSFIAGANYFYDNNGYEPLRVYLGSVLIQEEARWFNPDRNIAVYAEGTFDITPRLTLTAGLRYINERRSGYQTWTVPPLTGNGPVVNSHAVIPRASLKYKITNDTNAYFTFSQGFKSGGISVFAVDGGGPGSGYAPEKITSYEVGVKSALSSVFSANVSGFYYNYTNLQVEVLESASQYLIENAPTAKIYGLDADISAKLTHELSFTAALSLVHARYSSYPDATVEAPFIIAGTAYGNQRVVIDASGNEMPGAPGYTLSLNADYTKTFAIGTLELSATGYLSGRTYFDSGRPAIDGPRVSQAPYGTLDARATWRPAGSRFRFEIWGKNITNKVYVNEAYIDFAADAVGYAPPATYGGAIKYTF